MEPKEINDTLYKVHTLYADTPNFSKLGDLYGIAPAHFWRAIRYKKVSAILASAIGTKHHRTRLTADVSPEELRHIDTHIRIFGFKNRTEFFRAWGRGEFTFFVARDEKGYRRMIKEYPDVAKTFE